MIDVKPLFTPAQMVRRLRTMPVIKTRVIDTVFPNRPQVPSAVIGADLVNRVANAMPLVKRGGQSIPATSETGSLSGYEPLPIRLSSTITGQDLQNLKLLMQNGSSEQWATNKTELLRGSTRKTAEGMAAQALTGTISWPVQLEGGNFDTLSVSFGVPTAFTPAKSWGANDAKLNHVFESVEGMEEALNDEGYGETLEIWAGKTAYSYMLAMAMASTTTSKVKVDITQEGINVGGYMVKRMAQKYRHPQTKTMTPVVADNDLLLIDLAAGHSMPYAAIDDLDGKLQSLPFFIKPITLQDPSGIKLVSESKPFPIPVIKAICKATVVFE